MSDAPVLVHLSSKDVISASRYEMRVKQDAIPGMSIPSGHPEPRRHETLAAALRLGHFACAAS
jgi:heme/copper-type cytochrome/quinol oxidase subunit 2